jgi:hypothetical protein
MLARPRSELEREAVQLLHLNAHRDARTTITLVLRKVQQATTARNLQIEWHVGPESVFPVHDKSQKFQVEVPSSPLIEDPQDRGCLSQSVLTFVHNRSSGRAEYSAQKIPRKAAAASVRQ